ncbi:hypothetical protein ABS858_23685 [Vibrio neptunius]|uniref:hypothetical protein n=1 Tax=Vibrio neptunius TaxID=170651 RepID=UPI0033161194
MNDDGTVNKWADLIIESGEGQATYIGFEKLETGKEVRDRFQVKGPDKVDHWDPEDTSWSDGRLRSEFDTLQLYDESGNPSARVPNRLGDSKGEAPEPITEAYPEFGDGGAAQLHVDKKILKYEHTEILPEE